jgi:hypothetical protein
MDSRGNTINMGTFLLNGGTIELNNMSSVTGMSSIGNSIATANFVMNNGTINLLNSGDVGAGANGGSLIFGQDFSMNDGTVKLQNTATLSMMNALAAAAMSFNNFTMNGGTLTVLNEGMLSGGSKGSAVSATNDILLNGTVVNENTGMITTAARGAAIVAGANLTLSGVVNNINSGSVANMDSVGSQLKAPTIILNNGTLNNSNSGPVSGTVATGSEVNGQTNPAQFNGGSVTNTNTGSVTGFLSNGSVLTFPSLTINNTIVINSNSGSVGNNANGANIDVGTSLELNGGSITNTNSGPVSMTGATGAELGANSLTINDGIISNFNSGSEISGGLGAVINVMTSIQINGGTLLNDAKTIAATIDVAPAGTLAGKGLFIGPSLAQTVEVTNAGTTVPGDPGVGANPGVMTIGGKYTQTSSGTFLTNIESQSSFSQLNVMGMGEFGTAALDGTLGIALSKGGVIQPGLTYRIIQTESGVSGTFATIENLNIPNAIPFVQYFPTFVLLGFTPTADNYVSFSGPVFLSVNRINLRLGREMEQVQRRFDSRKKEPEPNKNEAVYSTQLTDISSQLVAGPILVQTPQTTRKQEQLRRELMADQIERPWNVYFGPTGGLGNFLTSKEMPGFNYWTAGALAGFDYAFSQVGMGFLFDYNHVDAHAAHGWGKFNIDQVHGSFYTTYVPPSVPELVLNGIVGGGYDWYNVHRRIKIGSFVAKGDTAGGEFDALFGIEYALRKRQLSGMPERLEIIPLFSLQYIYLTIGGYREHGADGFDLKVNHQSARSLRSTLGTRINYKWKCNDDITFTPELDLGWQREFLDESRSIHFAPARVTGPKGKVEIPRAGRDIALLGADFLVMFYEKYGLEVSYDFEWSRRFHDHAFYVGTNFRF